MLLSYKNRSGSTFLINKLDQYLEVCSVPEGGNIVNLLDNINNEFTKELYNQILEKCQNPNDKMYAWRLFPEDLQRLKKCKVNWEAFKIILEAYRDKFNPKAKFIVFKHPKINKVIASLDVQFVNNNIYIITLIRDGRAIYASSKSNKQSGINIPMEVNPFISAKGWRHFLNEVEKHRNTLPSDIYFIIKYEDLVLKYEDVMKNLVNSIGIREETSKSILSQKIHEQQKHLHPNVDKRPDVRRINNWKSALSNREIYAFQYKNTALLKKYGYEIYQGRYSSLLRSLDWLYYMFKSVWYKIKFFK